MYFFIKQVTNACQQMYRKWIIKKDAFECGREFTLDFNLRKSTTIASTCASIRLEKKKFTFKKRIIVSHLNNNDD